MHFHADAVDDLGWPPSFELELPGIAAGRASTRLALEADGRRGRRRRSPSRRAGRRRAGGRTPFCSRPSPTWPTRASARRPPPRARDDPRTAGSPKPGCAASTTATPTGVGVYEASLLRPLTQLRPGYRCPQHGGPHGLAQDLILIGWLRAAGHRRSTCSPTTTCTREGAAALAGHRTVITGAHPEYASAALLDALDAHLEAGGSLAYLGGNGLNGSVSVDPARPHVIELRRSETQGLVWQALPGEHHHASGRVRRRLAPPRPPRAPHARRGPPRLRRRARRPPTRRAGTDDPAAAIVFDGLDPGGRDRRPGRGPRRRGRLRGRRHDPRARLAAGRGRARHGAAWATATRRGPTTSSTTRAAAPHRAPTWSSAGAPRAGRCSRSARSPGPGAWPATTTTRSRGSPRTRSPSSRASAPFRERTRWLTRRRARRAGASTRSWSAPGTTGSSPRPTWRGPGCGRRCVERREIVGGACTTEEFAPGFRASPGAYVLSLLRPAIWRDFALRARGLEVLEAAPTLNVFRDGATADAARRRSRDRRASSRASTAATRAAFAALSRRAGRDREAARPVVRPPGARRARLARPRLACGRSPAALGAARRHGLAAAKLFATSARDHLEQRFRSEHVRAALGWDSISNTLAGPSTPGHRLLRCCTSTPPPRSAGAAWGFVRGGMGRVTALLADAAARGRGRDRHRGAGRADPRRGRARGQRSALAEGGELAAPTRASRTPTRSGRCSGWSSRERSTARDGGRDRGLPLRGREPEDQPRGRRAAADRRHPGGPAAPPPRPDPAHPAARRDGRRPGGRPARDPGRRPRTSSSASPAPSTPRWRRRGATCVTLGFRSQPYRLAGVGLGRRARPDRRPPDRRSWRR